MSMRRKVILFTIAFLFTSVTLGLGAYLIFRNMGSNVDALSDRFGEETVYSELTVVLFELTSATERWAATHDPVFLDKYNAGLSSARGLLGELSAVAADQNTYRLFMADFNELVAMGSEMTSSRVPLTSDMLAGTLAGTMKLYEVQKATVFMRLKELHSASIEATKDAVAEGEKIKSNMTFYMIVLIAFCFLSSAVLVILMRRLVGEPYKELLDATERVSLGDLGHRMREGERSDEFGIIARRFNEMVEGLERSDGMIKSKLGQTELLLEVARIAGVTSEMKEAMDLIVKNICFKMDLEVCGVMFLRERRNAFVLESSNVEGAAGLEVSLDSDTAVALLKSFKPIVSGDISGLKGLDAVCSGACSFMLAPIVRDNDCIGLLLLGRKTDVGFREDEFDTATILAYTIGSAVKNIELYEAAKSQLSQLRTVYELSKSITSVFIPEKLLKTITDEIVKLMHARGCIIRLLEGGALNAKSFSGDLETLGEDASLPVGRGIAGWVAREGRPILVEDVSKLPEEMSAPVLAARSVIAVPLQREGKIIGTLGLYDKVDEEGGFVPFTPDDLAVAEGFAYISALAIDKMRMQEKAVQSEARIREANKRMELLFESVQGGIVTLDRDYKITSANKYVEKWVNRPLEQIVSMSAREVFHGQGGICPHCVAKGTFEFSDVNSITQSSGLNYAELTSYPIKDEDDNVTEAVVFIQDITERVLYQEEIMGLYKEVMRTKEYIESLINNSADAIVTTDMAGGVTSWNPAAEIIYGYPSGEVTGKFMPFIPDSLMAFERENIERIGKGEVLKLETFRKRKDGKVIEVALTLSPIKDVAGEVIGISGISRDVTERKRVEKELIRRNQELSRLFFISSAMRSTLDLDRLLRMVLTAVTMSDGLGFNRAILFLLDEEAEALRGAMGVGPGSPEEAWQVWEKLSVEKRTLRDIMLELERGAFSKDSFLDRLSVGLEVPLSGNTALTRAVLEMASFNVADARADGLADPLLIQQLGTEAYAVVPLISRDKVIGVIWVDNLFSRKPITEEDMKFLEGFADQVASAIEAARLFRKVSLAEAELGNIFRSISDMVFITDKDYVIKRVNQAVEEKIGLPGEQIVGQKCYRIFHGIDEPLQSCPHHKTVETMAPYAVEVDDPHLKGTFLSSASPVFDLEEHFLGTVHVVRDITGMKQMSEKLHDAERMAALGAVAAQVAHVIRNPLVSVGGFAKRLESKLDGNLQEYARIITTEVKRLELILKDILGFVKEVRIAKASVDLNRLVGEIAVLLGDELEHKGNRLRVEAGQPSVMVYIDPDRVQDALMDLVSNANQATDGGEITIRTYTDGDSGVFEITDTGCGIKPENLPRIFDPFFTTRATGTGLGLAIARRIIEEHNGTIAVESREGEGTKFTVRIPLKGGKE